MKRKMLNFPAVFVLFSALILLLPPCAMADGDGAWNTTASPGYIFLTEEGMVDGVSYLALTVIEPGYKGFEIYQSSGSRLACQFHRWPRLLDR